MTGMDMDCSQYVRRVLAVYRSAPGVCGAVRKPDRDLAARCFARGVPLAVVENAIVLACMRRLVRRADALPLGVIRSLAYFTPVVDEVLERRVDAAYFHHLRQRLAGIMRRS